MFKVLFNTRGGKRSIYFDLNRKTWFSFQAATRREKEAKKINKIQETK